MRTERRLRRPVMASRKAAGYGGDKRGEGEKAEAVQLAEQHFDLPIVDDLAALCRGAESVDLLRNGFDALPSLLPLHRPQHPRTVRDERIRMLET
jgi:hypothetical protein